MLVASPIPRSPRSVRVTTMMSPAIFVMHKTKAEITIVFRLPSSCTIGIMSVLNIIKGIAGVRPRTYSSTSGINCSVSPGVIIRRTVCGNRNRIRAKVKPRIRLKVNPAEKLSLASFPFPDPMRLLHITTVPVATNPHNTSMRL